MSMKLIITTVILTGLAIGAGRYAYRIQDHLMNKAVGLPDELPKMPAPVPPEKQQVLDDFNDPNNQFEPSPDDPHKLIPVDPERLRAMEESETWGTVRDCARGAAWIIPGIGVLIFARKLRAKIWPQTEAAIQGFGRNPSPGPLDESGGIEGEEAVAQLADLKAYLSASEKNEESAEESEEGQSLLELLAAFKEMKSGG